MEAENDANAPQDGHPPYDIRGSITELGGGRSVFVGQSSGDSSVFINFCNGEMDTKVRLSFDAAKALRELLGLISTRGLMAQCEWVLVAEKAADTQTQLEERSDEVDPAAKSAGLTHNKGSEA